MKSTLLSIDSYELDLTVRVTNVLRSEDISTVEELLTWSSGDLLKVPNLGRLALREIIEKLAQHRLQLSSETDAKCASHYGQSGKTEEISTLKNNLSEQYFNALPSQKAMIDIILATNPDEMTHYQRIQFAKMASAYIANGKNLSPAP